MSGHFTQLAEILGDVLKVPAADIRPETRLYEDLQANSLDGQLILMEIGERFDVLVPERGRTYQTVGDLLAHLEEILAQAAAGAPEPVAVEAEA